MKTLRDYINISNILHEANVIDMSTLNWNKTPEDSPFVQNILKQYAAENKLSISDVQKKFNTDLEKTKKYLEETPVMSKTMLKGIVEQVLFNFVPKSEDEVFDLKTLKELFTNIEGTYSQYFPLHDGSTGKIVYPSIHITPSVFQQPDWMKGIETAAASADADIVFNKSFAQKLIYYARMKNVKGNAKYYVSQGGDIPDSYVYIEFLIRHEMGHILRGDMIVGTNILADWIEKNKASYPNCIAMFGGNIKNLAHRVNNYVADYIMNAQLVKGGLPQLPIGLFSEDINYDEHQRISSMWKIVLDEMEDQSEKAQQQMKDQMDDHLSGQDNNNEKQSNDKSGKDQNGQQGQQGQSQDGQSQDGQSQDGQSQDGQSQDGQSQDGQQGQPSQNSQKPKPGSLPDTDKIDQKNKDIQKKIDDTLNKRSEGSQELEQQAKDARDKVKTMKASDIDKKLNQMKKSGSLSDIQFDDNYTRKFTWQKILKKMMPSDNNTEKDQSYSRVSKRNSAGLLQLKQRGIAAAKPGEINLPEDKKNILMIIDNSGSVQNAIGQVNAEIAQLIKKFSKNLGDFYILKFDTKIESYKVDIKTQTATRYTNAKEILKGKDPKGQKLTIKKMFDGSGLGGGTEFSTEILKIAKAFLDKNTNCILFSDTDLLYGSNAKNVNMLMQKYGKVPFKFNVIMDSESSFNSFVKAIKAYKYLSYFDL